MKRPPQTIIRSLKIEAIGDFYAGRIKARIRLSGHWLEAAGFEPGGRVSVQCVQPGTLLLSTGPQAVLERGGVLSG